MGKKWDVALERPADEEQRQQIDRSRGRMLMLFEGGRKEGPLSLGLAVVWQALSLVDERQRVAGETSMLVFSIGRGKSMASRLLVSTLPFGRAAEINRRPLIRRRTWRPVGALLDATL